MKNQDPTAEGGSPADPGDAQEVGLEDVEVTAEPASSRLPPRLPPLPPEARASQAPGSSAPSFAPPPSFAPSSPSFAPPPSASFAPPPPSPSFAPAPPPSRGPIFYVGVLVAVLVVSTAVGTVVARSRSRGPAAATPTASAPPAPKVITIKTVEMDDSPDGGP